MCATRRRLLPLFLVFLARGSLFAQLAIAVGTPKKAYSVDDPIVATISIMNTGVSSITIPTLNDANKYTYVVLSATDLNGWPIVFFNIPGDTPVLAATSMQTLQPGARVQISMTLGDGGAGPFRYLNYPDVSSLALAAGAISLSATVNFGASESKISSSKSSSSLVVTSSPTVVELVSKQFGDINADGKVDCDDVNIVKQAFGKSCGMPGFDHHADINDDCIVDVRDLAAVSQHLAVGTKCP